MNYETIKSFILVVLVGISFLLSFILWSYQPNYESTYDTSYVSEVDVGGKEKTKNELIEPSKVIFSDGNAYLGFTHPLEVQKFYQQLTSWTMYDLEITNANLNTGGRRYVEVMFNTAIPPEVMMHLFAFDEQINLPDWSFGSILLVVDDQSKSIEVRIVSTDRQKMLSATVDKTENYQLLQSYFANENDLLAENMVFDTGENIIYLPREQVSLDQKTVIASKINPDEFIDALFRNPSLVTPNIGEAYFTDGQRGLRVFQDGLRMEFINPIQANRERLSAFELIEKSMDSINEHKGWTNHYALDEINRTKGRIRFRLSYDGFPVFDHQQLSIIEQEWRNQDLYEYQRPLIQVGGLLNSSELTLSSGENIRWLITQHQRFYKMEEIQDIQAGYFLKYNDEAHSLTLEPSWFILYKNDWMRFDPAEFMKEEQMRGED